MMFRNSNVRALVMALALLLAAGFAGAGRQNGVERLSDRSRLDWNKGVITATGLGAVSNKEPNSAKAYLRAREYARIDALANLLAAIDNVRVDAKTVGRDFEADTTIKAEIQGLVRGSRVVGEREIRRGGGTLVEVTVAMPLYGEDSLAEVILPEVQRRHAEEAPVVPDVVEPAPDPDPIPAPRPRREDPILPPASRGERHTSVIIDARGLNVQRAMSPKLLRRDGSEVWGTVTTDLDYVIEHGIVSYANSLSQAKANARAGANPLVIKASGRGASRFRCDVVLSDEDADELMAANAQGGFLNKFRVILLVDPGN